MKIFIALGSNLGEKKVYLSRAIAKIKKIPGVSKARVSAFYETDPVGGPEGQEKYLNAALQIETSLPARKVLTHLLEIEKSLGRERSVKNAPRTIDLDLVLYGDQVIEEPGLSVPHPRLHEREFVLRPLCDLAPDFQHPILKKAVKELFKSIEHGAECRE